HGLPGLRERVRGILDQRAVMRAGRLGASRFKRSFVCSALFAFIFRGHRRGYYINGDAKYPLYAGKLSPRFESLSPAAWQPFRASGGGLLLSSMRVTRLACHRNLSSRGNLKWAGLTAKWRLSRARRAESGARLQSGSRAKARRLGSRTLTT